MFYNVLLILLGSCLLFYLFVMNELFYLLLFFLIVFSRSVLPSKRAFLVLWFAFSLFYFSCFWLIVPVYILCKCVFYWCSCFLFLQLFSSVLFIFLLFYCLLVFVFVAVLSVFCINPYCFCLLFWFLHAFPNIILWVFLPFSGFSYSLIIFCCFPLFSLYIYIYIYICSFLCLLFCNILYDFIVVYCIAYGVYYVFLTFIYYYYLSIIVYWCMLFVFNFMFVGSFDFYVIHILCY